MPGSHNAAGGKTPRQHGRGPIMRESPASLASAVAVLAEAVEKYSGSPGRLHDVVDRLAFRIRSTDDLFAFCPRQGPLPLGGGTLWGLICEADPVSAGVLIRRLLVERIGEVFTLTQPHQENLLFSLEEHPENIAIYEVFGRCAELRRRFANSDRPLEAASEALDTLKKLLLGSTSPTRLETDRGCIGKTSGVFGVRDSDAYFVEADLLRAVLEVLLSPECSGLPSKAASEESRLVALRRLCMNTLDISCLLHEYPRVLSVSTAFLSAAISHAFEHQPVHIADSHEELWTFLHLLMASSYFNFVEDVINACAASRLHDAGDLRAVYPAIFGPGVNKDAQRDGRAALAAVRFALCHSLLLLFNTLPLFRHSDSVPPRFVSHVASLYKTRLLPLLNAALNGPVSGRWPEVRKALNSLIGAIGKAPMSRVDVEDLRNARQVFCSFAASRFLSVEGSFDASSAKDRLDPYDAAVAHAAADAAAVRPRAIEAATRSEPETAHPSSASPVVKTEALPIPDVLERELASIHQRQSKQSAAPAGMDASQLPTGQHRRLEMRFMKLSHQTEATNQPQGAPPPTGSGTSTGAHTLSAAVPGANLSCLPQPLPLGSSSLRSTGASTLVRTTKLPGDVASSAKGCFYNTASAEYVC